MTFFDNCDDPLVPDLEAASRRNGTARTIRGLTAADVQGVACWSATQAALVSEVQRTLSELHEDARGVEKTCEGGF